MHTPSRLTTLVACAALGLLPALQTTPAQAATPASWTVHAGNCSGAVLNTRSGSWIITARHCGAVRRVSIGSKGWNVRRVVAKPGPLVTNDVELLQVDGNARAWVGGGFAVGRAPRNGSRITVRGFATGRNQLLGCSGLAVSYDRGFPEVHHCYLPGGTSGGPWYTNDAVLRGVVGGLNGGGSSNYTTNTIPFGTQTVNWVFAHIY